MNDCPNADIRDQLPDLLHERLDVSMRAAVMAHVDACVDCRAELELLRSVHEMLVSRTPRVDINYVVNALPKRAAQPVRVAPRHRAWSDWRIAAAVTVLAVGGGSFALLRHGATPATADSAFVSTITPSLGNNAADSSAPRQPSANPNPSESRHVSQPAPANTVASADDQPGLATSARLADLNERELKALLNEIDQLQAVPITEPEPVTIRVNSGRSSPEGL
jgi:hypothetical protein